MVGAPGTSRRPPGKLMAVVVVGKFEIIELGRDWRLDEIFETCNGRRGAQVTRFSCGRAVGSLAAVSLVAVATTAADADAATANTLVTAAAAAANIGQCCMALSSCCSSSGQRSSIQHVVFMLDQPDCCYRRAKMNATTEQPPIPRINGGGSHNPATTGCRRCGVGGVLLTSLEPMK